jgi:hypothetical protein
VVDRDLAISRKRTDRRWPIVMLFVGPGELALAALFKGESPAESPAKTSGRGDDRGDRAHRRAKPIRPLVAILGGDNPRARAPTREQLVDRRADPVGTSRRSLAGQEADTRLQAASIATIS